METTEIKSRSVSKCTVSFGIALIAASVVDALLVVAKEKIPSVNHALQHLTGHHWISHVLIVLAVFIGGGVALRQGWDPDRPGSRPRLGEAPGQLTKAIVAGVTGSALAIVAFYLIAG